MHHEKFDELKLTGNLPSPAGVGLRILQLTQDEACALEDVVSVIQIDPALSGRVIKLANSALYAGRQPATTVAQASIRLGVQRLRAVSLGFTLVTAHRTGECQAFDYRHYWGWSLACAVAAQAIARRRGDVDPVEAFTAGLISRVGQLALATVHPDVYGKLLTTHDGAHYDTLLGHETHLFHINHLEVTAAMMADWGLPDALIDAVLHSRSLVEAIEAEDEAEQVSLFAPVLRASYLIADCWLDGIDPVQEPSAVGSLENVGHDLDLDRDAVAAVCEELAEELPKWAELLDIPARGPVAAETARPVPEPPRADEVAPNPDPTLSTAERHDGPPPKVLVADDDSKQIRLITHYLERAGYEVITAPDGKEALELAVCEHPQIVVTDWMMPEISGLDLCKALRRTQTGRSMYVLILTAREDEDRIVEAFNAGADDYVSKPFNPRILLARVRAGRRLIELQQQVDLDKQHRMRQVAEMGRLTRKLRAAALTDVLTELPNRRFAIKRLEEEWARARETRRPLSVVMVDIDHFKRVNDEHGHDVGDAVLRETARVLRARTRRADFVCRLGGEEFLIINVNSGIDTAAVCAERLRASVEEHRIECGDYAGSVTVSLGLAELDDSMASIDDLLKASDEAVYEAKAQGRNRVVRSDEFRRARSA